MHHWSAPRGIDVLYLNLCSISRDRCSSPRPAGRLDKVGPPKRSSADRINQRITPFSEEASHAPQPAIALINNVGKKQCAYTQCPPNVWQAERNTLFCILEASVLEIKKTNETQGQTISFHFTALTCVCFPVLEKQLFCVASPLPPPNPFSSAQNERTSK